MTARPDDPLVDALQRPGASFMCLDLHGTEALPAPAALLQHCTEFIRPETPITVFDSASAGLSITSFFRARSEGFCSVILARADGLDIRAEYYDDRPRTEAIVVVMIPANGEQNPNETPAVELPERHIVGRVTGSGQTFEISDGVTKLLGWSKTAYMTMPIEEKVHPADIPRVIESFVELLGRPGGQTRIRLRFLHSDGTWRWFETTQTNLLDTDDPHVLAESLDISSEMEAQTELQEREALLSRLNEALPVGILHVRNDSTVALANAMWEKICQAKPGDDLGNILAGISETKAIQLALEESRNQGTDADMTVTFADINGNPARHGELRIRPLHSNEAPFGLLLTLTDVTQSVQARAKLWDLARNDHLTQVRNRLGIDEALTDLLAHYETASATITVVYFDLDNFKSINDRHGHIVGDEVLAAAAEQVRLQLRPRDIVGRLGGDEFLAVLIDTTAAETRSIVSRVQRQLRATGATLSEGIEISTSIGVAIAQVGDTFDELVGRADADMYRNKLAKRSTVSR